MTPEARRRVNEALGEALRNPEVGPIDIGDTCQTTPDDEDCAMKALAFKAPEDSPAEVEERLVKILKRSRKRKLETGVSQAARRDRELQAHGDCCRGLTVHVRWSFTGRCGGLPHDWLKRQRPASWEAEADQDSVSPNVWVPLPPRKRAAVRPLDRRGRGRRAAGPIQHAQVSVSRRPMSLRLDLGRKRGRRIRPTREVRH